MDTSTLGTTPISPESPGGSDVRYDPDFEALQAEIDKMTSPTAAGQVNWARVADLAVGILQTKSKDLTVAGYLAVALLMTRQITGLDEGTALLRALLENFWENLYPPKKRMRGRAGAIAWWLDKSENALTRISPPPSAADLVTRLQANLQAMDSLLAEKMPDAPLLRSLQRRIEALPVARQEPAVPEPPAVAAAQASGGAPQATSAPAGAPQPASNPAPGTDTEGLASVADARRAADAAMQRLRQVSLFMLQQDAGDPLPYRYRRVAGWARVTATPPVNNDGNTAIAPPPPQVMTQMGAQRNAGNLTALILNAEPKVSQYIFCFDLHRHVAEALGDLGDAYHAAREAVCQETAALLRRLPALATLHFADGTPFADPQTRQWLEQIGTATAAPVTPTSDTGTTDTDPLVAVVAKARAMARRKQLIEAVALLQREMQGSESHRLAMRCRLAIIRLLLENKKAPAALPHVDRVLCDMDRFQLEHWEPGLAVEALTVAWQSFNAQGDSEHKVRAGEMLHRMAAVDPAAALRTGP